MNLYFLDHLCFFWTLDRINNHITEKSIYFEKGPAIILKEPEADIRNKNDQVKNNLTLVDCG